MGCTERGAELTAEQFATGLRRPVPVARTAGRHIATLGRQAGRAHPGHRQAQLASSAGRSVRPTFATKQDSSALDLVNKYACTARIKMAQSAGGIGIRTTEGSCRSAINVCSRSYCTNLGKYLMHPNHNRLDQFLFQPACGMYVGMHAQIGLNFLFTSHSLDRAPGERAAGHHASL